MYAKKGNISWLRLGQSLLGKRVWKTKIPYEISHVWTLNITQSQMYRWAMPDLVPFDNR